MRTAEWSTSLKKHSLELNHETICDIYKDLAISIFTYPVNIEQKNNREKHNVRAGVKCRLLKKEIQPQTSIHQQQPLATLYYYIIYEFLKQRRLCLIPNQFVLASPWALGRTWEINPLQSDVNDITDPNFFLWQLSPWNEIPNPQCQCCAHVNSSTGCLNIFFNNTYSKVKKSPQVTRMSTRVR